MPLKETQSKALFRSKIKRATVSIFLNVDNCFRSVDIVWYFVAVEFISV